MLSRAGGRNVAGGEGTEEGWLAGWLAGLGRTWKWNPRPLARVVLARAWVVVVILALVSLSWSFGLLLREGGLRERLTEGGVSFAVGFARRGGCPRTWESAD